MFWCNHLALASMLGGVVLQKDDEEEGRLIRKVGKTKNKKLLSGYLHAACRARMSNGRACGNERWLGRGLMMLV